ncbi:MAG: YfhO family protein [Ignavibacteriae bacterium]|nr:YfhO family protein [Ignavibacteriota bacterium]
MSKQIKRPQAARAAAPSFLARFSPLQLDLVCIGLLYVLMLVVFRNVVFNDAAFSSEGDTAAALSYTEAGNRIAKAENVDVLWMPQFFSGMPTFGNVAYIPHNVSYVQQVLQHTLNLFFLNGKWTWAVVYYFLGAVFMFMMMRTLKFSRPAALFAAVLFMLGPYNIALASEGHGSKLMALCYVPLVFMFTHLLFERKDLLSFGLLTAAIGTLALTNHMQIVYYGFMVIGAYLLYHIIMNVKAAPGKTAIVTAAFAGAVVIGLGISAYIYLSVQEFAQFSIRGGGTAGSTGGLAWDYATNWSWHPEEIITLLIPGFFGFQTPLYWGTMPFTSSTIYVGVLPLVLAGIALAYNRTRLTWFFGILALVMVVVAFGKHLPLLYGPMFDYLPYFNKFRVPVMVLHLFPFVVGVLAGFGLDWLLEIPATVTKERIEKLSRTLLIAGGVLLALLVIGLVIKSSLFASFSGSMFSKEDEMPQLQRDYGANADKALAQLKQMRFDTLWKDFVKFVLLAAASLGIVVLYLKRKASIALLTVAVFALLLIDLLIVINKGNYVTSTPQANVEARFKPDATVTWLLGQPGLFRIFPLADGFNDNTYAYHGLQSIGGYSPAKLKIYQTMLDSCLYAGTDPSFPLNMNIVNMLNAQYLVFGGRLPEDKFTLAYVDQEKRVGVYKNPSALARAFFVDTVLVAANDHEVFGTLNAPGFNAARMAVVQSALPAPCTRPDSARVSIEDFKSRAITMKAYTSSAALLVLSEVYYPAGWKATIDGNETEILRTNSVLRSVVVPAGEHTVVFSFDPPVYKAGYTISNVAWAIALICILIGLWQIPAVRERVKGKSVAEAKK